MLGLVVLLSVLIDLYYTTLSHRGGGFITSRLARIVWKLMFWMSGRNPRKKILQFAGLLTTMITLYSWVLLTWAGNSLIYIADYDSVVNASSGIPASEWEKVYFTGFTLSTLGIGDFKPNGTGWQVYTAVASFTGLFLMTIAITYFVPVLNADIKKRGLSLMLASMGGSPKEVLLNGWNGKDFSNLESQLQPVAEKIIQHGQQHLAYPVLSNYQSSQARASIAVNVAAFDEAISIMLIHLPSHLAANEHLLQLTRDAITSYLVTLRSAFISASDKVPPRPNVDYLKRAGVTIRNSPETTKEWEDLEERRSLLLGLLENEGWNWNEVYEKQYFKIEDNAFI